MVRTMKKRLWTQAETEYLIMHYANTDTEAIAMYLNRDVKKVLAKANKIGLKKTKEYIQRRSVEAYQKFKHKYQPSHFQKGHVPANKGVAMKKEVYAKLERTMFKKGTVPHNFRPAGSERESKDGYLEVKVNDSNKWQLKHRVIWENANGKIEKGFIIAFKDNNKKNCCLENLEKITLQDNMKRNSIIQYPEELQQVIRLKGKLKRTIKKLEDE